MRTNIKLQELHIDDTIKKEIKRAKKEKTLGWDRQSNLPPAHGWIFDMSSIIAIL